MNLYTAEYNTDAADINVYSVYTALVQYVIIAVIMLTDVSDCFLKVCSNI